MMKRIFLLFFLVFGPQTTYSFSIQILNDSGNSYPTNILHSTFSSANSLFETTFGVIDKKIQVELDSKGCFRTGYNFIEKKIVFCRKPDIYEMGLLSEDVIAHELFHAFLCNLEASLCEEDINVPLHEGLADYFAYLLKKDSCFGENFYFEAECIRFYQTDLEFEFVEEDHAIGNTIVKTLVNTDYPLRQSIDLFKTFSHSYLVEENLFGREKSKFNKYRLGQNEKFVVEFTFPENSISKITWSTPENGNIKLVDHNKIEIELNEKSGTRIYLIKFMNKQSQIVGYKKYYFGKKAVSSQIKN